jgi:hypothetical protein
MCTSADPSAAQRYQPMAARLAASGPLRGDFAGLLAAVTDSAARSSAAPTPGVGK